MRQGYALVEFETFEDASKAIETLNGTEILGQVRASLLTRVTVYLF